MKNTNINNNSSINNNENPVPISNPPIIIKKARPKTASPTRHGPQQCQVCNKVFGNASALAKHKLTHSDERKYVCGMCSKAFKRQDHLNGHMLTHRNKKPYECKAEGCGKSYCDARSLRRHTENHHTTVPISPITLATANTTIHHLQNHNQHFSPMLSSTGPPSSLSLSPSTACGDASSPHGATCIQFSTSSTICNADSNSKTLPHSQDGGKNLTSQHINLINHIMQQSKYANENNSLIAPVITSTNNNNSTSVDDNNGLHKQRPRTWNMQTQLQQANISPILESCITTNGISTTSAIHVLTKLEQKPVECNLCHRKFKNIPALNGHMRLHGGYFKKDSENKKSDKKDFSGPPLQTASLGIRALIEEKIISKRGKDLKGAFVTPAPPLNILTSHDITESKNVTPKDSCNISELQTANAYKKAIANCGLPLHTSTETGVILPKVINSAAITYNRPNPLPAKRNDGRDSTLIELLKRGTKIEVKRNGEESVFEIATRTHNLIDISNPVTPISTPPPTINNTRPLSLTISPVNPSDGSDIFTLSYSSDVPTAFFANTESDVYNISDSSMLLQAVDSITELDEISNIKNFSLSDADQSHIMASYIPSNQLRTVLNSPLPDSLAEFSTLHSKELILYGSSNPSQVLHTSISPLPSPFAYPTPPASHETIPQASPFLDDSHHFSDGRQFFDDKKNELSFLDENNSETFIDATDNFKSELLNNVEKDHDLYDTSVEDILVSTDTTDDSHGQNDNLIDFNANLTFFDESHNFLETTNSPDNPTSPLSAAFFSSTMSSAEKVKEALQEVLPDDNILHSRGSRNSVNNNISLYYLPAISMQSNIMLNSDDPLLSSSPKDYAVNKQVIAVTPRLDFNSFQSHQTDTTKKVNPSKSICDNVNVTFRSERTLSSVENYSKDKHSTFKDSIENTCINKSNNTERLTAGSITSDDLTSALLLRKRNHSNNLRNTCDSCEPLDKNKCVKINIYKSKMKVLSHHYIPAPMLDPKRLGIGLYSMFASDPANEDLLDDHIGFDDFIAETVSSNDIAIQSNTNIGSEFQANIPKLQNKKELLTTVQNQIHNSTFLIDNICNDQLQWDPSSLLNCRIDEQKLARFVELTKSSAIPSGSHSEETALKALLRANGNIPIAILSLMDTASLNAHKRWSQNEVEIFLRCLEEYGKNFYRISKEVLTKTTADCVEFYYFWKKLTIDYKISSTKDVNNSSDPLIKNRSIKMWSLTEQDGGNKPTSAYNSSSLTMQSVQHNLNTHSSQSECRPHVCEMPDCSASFTSKAALHGHTRIHCIGKNFNSTHQNQSNIQQMVHNQHNVGNNSQSSTVPGNMSLQILKSETSTSFIRDDFPCKVCGKIFNKVKSRSAHMKSHRPQDLDTNT